MLETGAYDPEWPDVHMQPEQTLQAHIDLKGRHLLPVHNGTLIWHFMLGMIHLNVSSPWLKNNLAISTPQMGELLNLNEPNAENYWWRS